jgi:hypothetical protein
MNRETLTWILPAVLAAAIIAGAWYYWASVSEAPADLPAREPAPDAPDVPIEPLHPMPETDFLADEDAAGLVELPPLGESDTYFKLELRELFGDPVADLIADTRVISRVVATVDNLPRGHVAEKMRPVSGLDDSFEVYEESEGVYAISEDSFRRYDALVELVANVDTTELADLYRRYYPLFQSAYVELGYPDGYFNDRLVEAIDDMLAAPDIQGPILLRRPHVLYQFADPDLEQRSSGQKLLLRMGSDNAARVRKKLEELRKAVSANDLSQGG